jgi:hypothetical protein
MSSGARGWLVFAVMFAGALVIVQLTASALEIYETRAGEHGVAQALSTD